MGVGLVKHKSTTSKALSKVQDHSHLKKTMLKDASKKNEKNHKSMFFLFRFFTCV
jgi:hypothetical protein